MRTLTLVFVVGLITAATMLATPFPGPDAFGYVGSSIQPNLRDISSTGTDLGLGDDDYASAIPIGFSFNFYGVTYSSADVSSNGFLSFLSLASSHIGEAPIPSAAAPNAIVAGLWADLDAAGGTVRSQTLGAPGSQEFVVGFYDVDYWAGESDNTFELILHEGSNNIELQYGSVTNDQTVSAGIENHLGNDGIQLYYGAAPAANLKNQGFLFTVPEQAIPEPATLSFVALGLAGLFVWRRRQRS